MSKSLSELRPKQPQKQTTKVKEAQKMMAGKRSPVADYVGKRVAVGLLLALVGLVAYQAGKQDGRQAFLGQFGVEVHTLAQMYVGEAKGQPEEWPDLFSAVLNRVDDTRFPGTIETVIKAVSPSGKSCEINAMCDVVMEVMTTQLGQSALLTAYSHLQEHYAGKFRRTHAGHSWATPAAATGHAYFESLVVVLKRSGHWYFGDISYAPKVAMAPPVRPTR